MLPTHSFLSLTIPLFFTLPSSKLMADYFFPLKHTTGTEREKKREKTVWLALATGTVTYWVIRHAEIDGLLQEGTNERHGWTLESVCRGREKKRRCNYTTSSLEVWCGEKWRIWVTIHWALLNLLVCYWSAVAAELLSVFTFPSFIHVDHKLCIFTVGSY